MFLFSDMVEGFAGELRGIVKLAQANFVVPTPRGVGGQGANVVANPLPSPGIKSTNTPKVKSTNYSMVHATAPMAALNAASGSKSVPPPPVRT
jgi:hypothetical protein